MKFPKIKMPDFLGYLLNKRYDSVAINIEMKQDLIEHYKIKIKATEMAKLDYEFIINENKKEIEELEINLRNIRVVLGVI